MKKYIGELVTGDLLENTMTFEIDGEINLQAGKYEIVQISVGNQDENKNKMKDRKPWSFCETPEEKCTMNYCDDNGCQNRQRNYVEANDLIADVVGQSEQLKCKCNRANFTRTVNENFDPLCGNCDNPV
jgi:hypothetical protein